MSKEIVYIIISKIEENYNEIFRDCSYQYKIIAICSTEENARGLIFEAVKDYRKNYKRGEILIKKVEINIIDQEKLDLSNTEENIIYRRSINPI